MAEFPYLKASSWVSLMDKKGQLFRLLGLGSSCNDMQAAEPHLLEFWSRYELSHKSHAVFQEAREGRLSLKDCIPCYLHGDEGTTFKKDGVLILSFYCPIGRGVAGAKTGEDPAALSLNFAGHGFKTRFVMASLLKAG